MNADAGTPSLEAISARLGELHAHALSAARGGHPATSGLALLDALINDPAWAWLRPLSALIAGVDQAGAQPEAVDAAIEAAAAAETRGLVFGEGDFADAVFLAHYRPLLQRHPALASTHGELRGLLRRFPAEPQNESDRLRARERWALAREPRRRAG